jgi:GGDEF domain-containing protein
VAQHGETLLVPEARGDPRVKQVRGARPKIVRSVIALPLRGRKGTHGVIEIFNPRAGQQLKELSRKQDLCFRYGGDEFAILMPETGEDAALTQADKLLRAFMATEFQMKDGQKLFVSASVGVATAPDDGATIHALIGAADMRMYAVKARGRGAVRGA